MKKLLILVLALTLGVSAASAQEKKQKKTETVKFVTDLDCESCAKKVLNVIPFKKGVKDCVVDVPTKTIEVTFDVRKTNAETIVAELKKIDVNVVEPKACEEPCGGACVSAHTKQDACCDGHDHNHDHNHSHSHAGHNHDHAGHNHAH